MPAVEVRGIRKSYSTGKTSVEALRGITLSIENGELFGIIGPDGSGKTSLFRILTTLLLANEGVAMVDGLDVVSAYKEIRKRVGYMPGRFSLYHDLTVEENLTFFATLFDTTLEENYDLVKGIYQQIEKFRTRKAGALSGGMKQKLALCCALIHRPVILFLDEPTTGVDAVSRKEFWQLLRNLQEQQITIVVSTPYMDEASLCDRVALIQEGTILAINPPKTIIKDFQRALWSVKSKEMFRLQNEIRELDIADSCYPFGQVHHVVWRKSVEAHQARRLLASKGHTDLIMEQIEPTIEDCFIDRMNRKSDVRN